MPRPCLARHHPRRKAIDEALRSGESYRNVAKRCGISSTGLFRHKAHIATAASTSTGDGETPQKVTVLAESNAEPTSSFLKTRVREEIFAREYLTDLNGTRAAIAAGYSENGADVTASRLLDRARVKKRVEKALEKRLEGLGITADNVLGELAKLGFSNMQDYIQVQPDGSASVDLSKLTREQAAPISEIQSDVYMEGNGGEARKVKRTKLKLASKLPALELLARHLKLIGSDRGEGGSTNVGIAVTVEHVGAKQD